MDESQKQADKPPANGGTEEAGLKNKKPSFWTRRTVIVFGVLVLAALGFVGLRYVVESFTHVSTDDAFLQATVVSVAPQVAGPVKKVWVVDNQKVKKGDPLVDIDPRNYQVELEQKKAARAAAEANVKLLEASLQLLGSQVATAEATAKQAAAEADADQATADKARADLKRAQELIRNRTISQQEFDAAKAAAAAADANFKAGQEKTASDQAKVVEAQAQLEAGRRAWQRAQAQAQQAAVDVDQADLNLSYTRIAAPQAGRVTRKAVEDGDYIQIGQRLMALVVNDTYVVANFKETQLEHIRTNQPVKIRVDSVGGRIFAGHVQSIQAGSGAAFSLLPPENAVGNFVKVVQRVPVKILFDKPIEAQHVLGPGMSVVPSIRVTSFELPDAVVAVAAAVLALFVGWLWWRAAKKKSGT